MKKYLDCFVPIYICNFKCHYCYVSLLNQFEEKARVFPRTPEEIAQALSSKRIGDGVFINLCAGGETLLLNDSVKLIRYLLEEGHHLAIVTNGSLTQRFDEIIKFPKNLLKRLFFKFSYHYLELKKRNLFDIYFSNICKVRDAGCSFTVEITQSDELIPYAADAKLRCLRSLGAYPHCTIARDDRTGNIKILSKLPLEKYKEQWATFESPLFDYKMYLYQHKIKTFCYAGDWTAYINLATGDVNPCNCGPVFYNIYKNYDESLPRHAMGNYCELPYCYNGHGWLSLGADPDEYSPVYSLLRNRICLDQSEWITNEFKRFWEEQLFKTNIYYDDTRKNLVNLRRYLECQRVTRRFLSVYYKIRQAK